MGWWEERHNDWQLCVIAQAGGADIIGAGVFFTAFRRPGLNVTPSFLFLSGGIGFGGSIGSGVSISWSDLIKQLAGGKPGTESYWNNVDGYFCPKDINRAFGDFVSAGASALIVGAQLVDIMAYDPHVFGSDTVYFRQRMNVPTDLKALSDMPQIQGGLGYGVFSFTGLWQYIGC